MSNMPVNAPASAARAYGLDLYVTGTTPNSVRAVGNLRRICEQHLSDACEMRVIDLYMHPELAARENVIAAPTLVKHRPPPVRRLVGDLSDGARVLDLLGLAREGLPEGAPGPP